jgi:hypothetical protein
VRPPPSPVRALRPAARAPRRTGRSHDQPGDRSWLSRCRLATASLTSVMARGATVAPRILRHPRDRPLPRRRLRSPDSTRAYSRSRSRWKGTITQYAGRLHRPASRKHDARIYDYVDAEIALLDRMYHKRERTYRSLGYQIETGQSDRALGLRRRTRGLRSQRSVDARRWRASIGVGALKAMHVRARRARTYRSYRAQPR